MRRNTDDMDIDHGDPFQKPVLLHEARSIPPQPMIQQMFPPQGPFPVPPGMPFVAPPMHQSPFNHAIGPSRFGSSPHDVPPQYQTKEFTPQSVYNDDQRFELKVIEEEESKENPVKMSLKCAYSPLELNSETKEVPCMISLKGKEIDTERALRSRPGIDLICVIDISGSMRGTKIALVIETLKFMLTLLNRYDRVSLVVFDHRAFRLCPLTNVDEAGLEQLGRIISSISTILHNEIEEGLKAGLRVIKDRRIANQATSILLLSDGVDQINQFRIDSLRQQCQYENTTGFNIHCFGYGTDHDPRILGYIAEKNHGNFYYVENEEKIAEAFANCIGEIATLVADRPFVCIYTQPCSVEFTLSKVYSENGDSQFQMPSVLSSSQKDSIFLLSFPGGAVQEGEVIKPVRVRVSAKLTLSGEQVLLEDELSITLSNSSEEIEVDEEVMVNFYRVKAAEILKEIIRLANNNQFSRAQELSASAVAELSQCVVKDSELIQVLIKDLQDAGNRSANQANWNRGGLAQTTSLFGSHSQQRAGVNTSSYQNNAQGLFCGSAQQYFGSKNS